MVLNRLVVEPWAPAVGDYVRVEVNPECRAWHSGRGGPSVTYGRIESIDRDWDDPDRWISEVAGQTIGDKVVTEEEARSDAHKHIGHYYHVQDCLSEPTVTWLDGYYCAFELTPVPSVVALAQIARARAAKARLSPEECLFRAVFGASS